MMKEMKVNLAEKDEQYELLVDRLRNLEQECSNLIQEKKELNDALEVEKNISKEFDEKLVEIETNTTTSRSKNEALTRLITEISNEIPPTEGQFEKCKGRIPIV